MTLEPWAQVSPGRMWVCTPAAGGTELAQRVLPLVPGRSPEPLGCTPPGPGDVVEGSAIVAAGRCVYSGVPLFDNFQAHGNAVFRDWVWALLDRVLPQRLVRHDGGPNVEVTLHAGKGLHVAHLVQWASELWPTRHMYPAQAPRLAGVNLQLRLPRPARVMSLPDQSPLAFTYKDGVLSLRSPSFTVHQAIAIET